MEKIVTSTSLIIIDGDVVKTYTNANIEYSEDSADENIAAVLKLTKEKPIYNLLVPDPTTYITIEARKFSNNDYEKVKLAEAIVIKTLGHRILAQSYRNARKDRHPVRVFDCESKALDWFKSLRKKRGSK